LHPKGQRLLKRLCRESGRNRYGHSLNP